MGSCPDIDIDPKLQTRSVANYNMYNIYNIQPVRVFICHCIIWSKVFFNMVKHLR